MSTSRRAKNEERTKAEVVTFVVSVLLLLALVGGIVATDLTRGDARVRIEATPDFDAAYEHDEHWYLPVTIENVGDRTAESIVVEVELAVSDGEPEVSELAFIFLAAGEEVEGTAAFTERPTPDNVDAFARSVTIP